MILQRGPNLAAASVFASLQSHVCCPHRLVYTAIIYSITYTGGIFLYHGKVCARKFIVKELFVLCVFFTRFLLCLSSG